MLSTYESDHARAFRRMFTKLPPYTMYNLRESKASELAWRQAQHASGFAGRTSTGLGPHERMSSFPTMTLNPAAKGQPGPTVASMPEAATGRILRSDT